MLPQRGLAVPGTVELCADEKLRCGDLPLHTAEPFARQHGLFLAEVRRGDLGTLLRQLLLRDARDGLRVDAALHAEDHVRRSIENTVAVVKRLRRDMGDALHRPGDAVAYRVVVIVQPKQVIVDDHAGVILTHAYLLRDYPLLLCDRLIREVRGRYKVQQHPQVLFKALGTLEVIAGHAA